MSPAAQLAPIVLPRGWGMRALLPRERDALLAAPLEALMNHLLIWEPPRRAHRYVLSVDVSDGVGQNRSVADVTRVGTVAEPSEQVAQFVTNTINPIDLAAYLDVIGRFYVGADSLSALMAIEVNNHGLVTQSQLQTQWGYENFFVWQREGALDPERRFTNMIGWETNRRTRRFLLNRWVHAVGRFDPNTGLPELRLNSPFTIAELGTFRRPAGGSIGDAEADPDNPAATDDCCLASAIGCQVVWTLHAEEGEPIDQLRARLAEEKQRTKDMEDRTRRRVDFQNTPMTYAEMMNSLGDLGELLGGYGVGLGGLSELNASLGTSRQEES